ncbi:MAG: hypothetical protein R2879_18705 [Saprospiraceae bacterium]
MKLLRLLIPFLFILLFYSCDPQSCRECGTFYFDITNWSIMDDTIKNEYIFLNNDSNTVILSHTETAFSEPGKVCQIAESEEWVGCTLTKKITYASNSLPYDLIISYEHFEVPGNNPATNNCYYTLETKNKLDGTHLITPQMEIFTGIDSVTRLIRVPVFDQASQSYSNVLRMDVGSMIEASTVNSPFPILATPTIREIYFKPPNGIIGLLLQDGRTLILKI